MFDSATVLNSIAHVKEKVEGRIPFALITCRENTAETELGLQQATRGSPSAPLDLTLLLEKNEDVELGEQGIAASSPCGIWLS